METRVSLTAAALKVMADKGLSAHDIAEIALANERRADPTATERKRRQRAKGVSRRDVTRDPPNDNRTLTPREVSEPIGSSPQPWALPVGVSLQVWTDFLTNRKRKRAPNTDTAWKGFCDDLKRVSTQSGIPPPKLIEHAAVKGWAGIYDPRDKVNDKLAQQVGKSQAAYAMLDPGDEPF
jgi:hypothetical protein